VLPYSQDRTDSFGGIASLRNWLSAGGSPESFAYLAKLVFVFPGYSCSLCNCNVVGVQDAL
jgi:hypothetical protein